MTGLTHLARRRGLKPELIDLRNSGDTAGDKSRVVGYGAFAFYEEPRNAS
ncbi:MAG TPA: AmmeMemoRadiSam system protein B [Burkholderiales bacterium]|nr:AmmeMemoRadiSam system protein B [Burkholderiales bacterium]